MYNPDKYTDGAQKKYAKRTLAEITKAYHEIMNSSFTESQHKYGYEAAAGGQSAVFEGDVNRDREEYFLFIRRLIQDNDFATAINSLETYRNARDRQWNFLMGCALYYNNNKSRATAYLRRAVSIDPDNIEYKSVFRM